MSVSSLSHVSCHQLVTVGLIHAYVVVFGSKAMGLCSGGPLCNLGRKIILKLRDL